MAISNKYGSMVLATGNKSEYAVGCYIIWRYVWRICSYKRCLESDVFKLCKWRNANKPLEFLGPKGIVIPERIITKPPSRIKRRSKRYR